MKQSTPGRPAVPSDHANLTKAQRTTPWRKWNLVGTRNSVKTARYIAERRAAGDGARPLRELDE